MTNLRSLRMVLWGLVALISVGVAGVYGWRAVQPDGETAQFGGPFSMPATTGERLTEADLGGTPTLIFFGYTFCPDVCPTTLFEASAWRQSLGLDENSLRFIFVTVDPARDSLDVVRDYLSPFNPPVIGLAGNATETEQIKSSFGIFSEIEGDGTDPNYLVSHTSSILMFDREGQFSGTIAFLEAKDTALAKLRTLVAS